jgi:hypothetical protein
MDDTWQFDKTRVSRTEIAATVASIADLVGSIAQPAEPAGPRSDAAQRGDDLLTALASLRRVREEIAQWEPQLIGAARAMGVSWAQLAPALGVASRQAAERRYLRVNPTARPEHTAEDRVRAVRDLRAGQRAVTAWARDNVAEIRQVAGQVSGTDGLSVVGRRHASDVREALATDDPTVLLPLLHDVGPHLRAEHPHLADHIDAITGTAQQHRDAARSGARTATGKQPGSPGGPGGQC